MRFRVALLLGALLFASLTAAEENPELASAEEAEVFDLPSASNDDEGFTKEPANEIEEEDWMDSVQSQEVTKRLRGARVDGTVVDGRQAMSHARKALSFDEFYTNTLLDLRNAGHHRTKQVFGRLGAPFSKTARRAARDHRRKTRAARAARAGQFSMDPDVYRPTMLFE
mmetsp:Transcript_43073/g.69930  ORF Transcript_43073/g.69930 Transcript_43073/m.69930 type:complete len:169 (-) Transcript_43073:353-859(-)|eukprot:CAMPEP_0184645902 /NCGR_PEP_ID=MMETSP0308-20130426/2490_1 /TAXON_ID=38269 /ORGANISM="Gloeochaete witrockiana, Strain SAG 46.84" /LENGTH=168 /DNA_ID=CAMNT_0027075393 /DNA_START=133 /DNA_END=639 /DNA_ORIENTATION=+